MNANLKPTLLSFTPHCKIIFNFKNNIAQIHATRRLEPWRPGLVLAPLVAGDLNIIFLKNIFLWEVNMIKGKGVVPKKMHEFVGLSEPPATLIFQ